MIIGSFRYEAEHDTYAGDIATLTLQRSGDMWPNDKSSDRAGRSHHGSARRYRCRCGVETER